MSLLEEQTWYLLQAAGLWGHGAAREHRFAKHLGRRWAFDFAWIPEKVALEVEGGVYANGRHTRGAGYTADIVKYNQAALLGWLVLRATPEQIDSHEAVRWVIDALFLRREQLAQGDTNDDARADGDGAGRGQAAGGGARPTPLRRAHRAAGRGRRAPVGELPGVDRRPPGEGGGYAGRPPGA